MVKLFNRMKSYLHIISLFFILFWWQPAFGNIAFIEVTKQAGMSHHSPTAGAAWGDFNGDGWPDLWVTNHYLTPSLYINQGDGTFLEVAKKVLYGQPVADYHGAAWADFDNDGDQDLLILTGGGAGRGQCPNYLFVNQDGLLKDHAKTLGIDYPLGRGRTPLWFDADRDGRLDVLIMNQPRPGGQASSALFLQGPNGFEIRSREFGFRHEKRTKLENILALVSNAIHLKFQRPSFLVVGEVFAQLADLSGDGSLDLASYSNPIRIYSIDTKPFREITNGIGFPNINLIQDIAIEDFDGDLQFDMYLARSNPWVSSVVQKDSLTLIGTISGDYSGFSPPKGIQFRSKGTVSFGLYPPWRDPSDPLSGRQPVVFLGAGGQQVSKSSITLSTDDKTVWGPIPAEKYKKQEISIGYDVTTEIWTLQSTVPYLDFTLKSTESIDRIQTLGFKNSKGLKDDRLLFQQNGHFIDKALSPSSAFLTASRSIAAADFDNDGDIDLYIVCASPTGNMPNLLYENDGKGNFSVVPHAGGAEGSELGRGENVVTADFDRDGFLDLFVTNGGGFEPIAAEGPHQLFRNSGNSNHWLELDFEGSTSNRDGIGVQILLTAGGIRQVRTQNGGTHFMAQHHQRVHLGLGKHTMADELVVHWPSGIVQRLENVKADQIMRIREPEQLGK